MNEDQLKELLYQAIETEIGGQSVYETAIRCAESDELREELTKYLDETRDHERILRETFEELGLDPETEPWPHRPSRKAQGLVQAMETALAEGGKPMAQLVAAESVVEAEEEEHLYHTMGWARELWSSRSDSRRSSPSGGGEDRYRRREGEPGPRRDALVLQKLLAPRGRPASRRAPVATT